MHTCVHQSWKAFRYLRLKQALLFALILLTGKNSIQAQVTSDYWSKNIAILHLRTRTINSIAYVREIVLLDFKKSEHLPAQFGFGTDLFSDDGLGYDCRPGDGIYTSLNTFTHSIVIPFIAINHLQSACEKIVIDRRFLYKKQLKSIVSVLQYFALTTKNNWPIECQLKQCACPSACICFACEWGSATWCLDWNSCDTTITLHW